MDLVENIQKLILPSDSGQYETSAKSAVNDSLSGLVKSLFSARTNLIFSSIMSGRTIGTTSETKFRFKNLVHDRSIRVVTPERFEIALSIKTHLAFHSHHFLYLQGNFFYQDLKHNIFTFGRKFDWEI